MKVRNVYECALNLLSEKGGSCVEYDFEERAPFIIAAAFSEAESLDREFRRAYGLPAFCGESSSAGDEDASRGDDSTTGGSVLFCNPVKLPLDSDFPLCDRFMTPAAYFTAAMLVVSQSSDLYEFFFDRWCDSLAAIAASLPAESTGTKDVYMCW